MKKLLIAILLISANCMGQETNNKSYDANYELNGSLIVITGGMTIAALATVYNLSYDTQDMTSVALVGWGIIGFGIGLQIKAFRHIDAERSKKSLSLSLKKEGLTLALKF